MRFLLALLAMVPVALGYKGYQNQIPNGARVRVPCKSDSIWQGVGHLNLLGGGPRNVFGLDFAAAGHRWTTELCQKDSDGDGRTNGEELGDPQCTWTHGTHTDPNVNVTHPGICEPLTSPTCEQKAVPPTGTSLTYSTQVEWMQDACVEAKGFHCDPLDQTPNVQTVDIRLPPSPVPAQETTYVCMSYEFPDVTRDYHVVAFEPVINNSNVMHHMLLFGCADDVSLTSGPEPCQMEKCPNLIAAWAVGGLGTCIHRDTGVRMGKTGIKRMMLQYHWNNPAEVPNFVDSSGMRLFYTPNLRPYDMAMMMIGQKWIEIQPGDTDAVATAECTPTCTRQKMHGDIYVTNAFNHMHLLGWGQTIEQFRDGQRVRYLTNEMDYDYATPKFFDFPDPIVVKPGDMLRTTCHFHQPNTTAKTTFYGPGTQDEMCYGFITYYPFQSMPEPECTSWKSLIGCDPSTFKGCNPDDWSSPAVFSKRPVYTNVTQSCSPWGPCRYECKQAIRSAWASDPCLGNEDTWTGLKWQYGLGYSMEGAIFLASVESCEVELYKEDQIDRF